MHRYIKSRSLPYTRVGGRYYFSQKKLQEWLLSKEEVPSSWNDQSFRAELADKEETLRMNEINERIRDLADIIRGIYKALGEESLKDEKNSEQVQLYDSAFQEFMALVAERDELKAKRKDRLRQFLGIQEDK